MSGYIVNIEEKTLENETFRTVLFTGPKSQLVVMSLRPGEDIGEEVHEEVDQFIRIEAGTGKVVLDGEAHDIHTDDAVVIPAGVKHNLVNTSKNEPLKLYTIYTPPEHREGTIHPTKAAALADEADHYFDQL